LLNNTSGYENIAIGTESMYSNTTGVHNISIGVSSMANNTSGFNNTVVGPSALYSNINGSANVAIGMTSLYDNTSGYNNTGIGNSALTNNTTGTYNTALGFSSGGNVTTGYNLTLIGYDAQPTFGSSQNEITLGNFQISKLRCNVQSITSLSDKRDKTNIRDLTLGLDFISKLKPRQFNWDKRDWYDNKISDGSKMEEKLTAGFIAQELDEVQISDNADWLNLVTKENPEKWEATYGNLIPVIVKAIQELKRKMTK
jgi:hypothetical protein